MITSSSAQGGEAKAGSCCHTFLSRQCSFTRDCFKILHNSSKDAFFGFLVDALSAHRRVGRMLTAEQPSGMAQLQVRSCTGSSRSDAEQADGSGDSQEDEHKHYSGKSSWLRAGTYKVSQRASKSDTRDLPNCSFRGGIPTGVLGALDGLVSIASLLLGVGGASTDATIMILAGLAGLVGGGLSMAAGEWVSVSSQRDAEMADLAAEMGEQAKGIEAQEHEIRELAKIYIRRGLSPWLARQVAEELTAADVILAHARDELGIDPGVTNSPLAATFCSMVSFFFGGGIPLLTAGFIPEHVHRLIALSVISTVTMAIFGGAAAALGGAGVLRSAIRVMIGGWLAMGITYAIGHAFGAMNSESLP